MEVSAAGVDPCISNVGWVGLLPEQRAQFGHHGHGEVSQGGIEQGQREVGGFQDVNSGLLWAKLSGVVFKT